MILGMLLALASAVGTNFLFEHRGAVLAPPIRVHTRCGARSICSPPDGSRSGGWSRSWLGACTSALSLAPLSVVQAVLSGGLVFFGFRLGRSVIW